MPIKGASLVAPGCDHSAVHSQLSKILSSHHFRNSKRSGALLRFVVEQAISGEYNSLKERTVGAAVFGRETAYDTAHDPIVRNAAIEVRKRLAQYYLEPEHTGELRIELPLGSYMPTFSVGAVAEPVTPSAEPVRMEAVPRTVERLGSRLKWVMAVAALASIATAAAFLWTTRRTPGAELDAFWEPLLRAGKTVQICIGQPTRLYRFTGPRTEELNRLQGARTLAGPVAPNESISPRELTGVAPEYLFLRDAFSALRLASWLQSKGRAYQVMSVADTSYSGLRHAPLVAIGAFNNQWAMRVTAQLRFVFNRRTVDGVLYDCIDDRRNSSAAQWRIAQPVTAVLTEDYAIVTRVFDPATENTVISAAGIEAYGTLAASEFITQAEYAGAALSAAPQGWRRKNAQFVLRTKIIDGTPGPPRVLAAHFW